MYRIYGASDDLIEIEGDISEEYGTDGGDFWIGDTPADDGAGFSLEFLSGGWTFVIGESVLKEDESDLTWPMRLEGYEGKYISLVVDCPDGTPLWWKPKDTDPWRRVGQKPKTCPHCDEEIWE